MKRQPILHVFFPITFDKLHPLNYQIHAIEMHEREVKLFSSAIDAIEHFPNCFFFHFVDLDNKNDRFCLIFRFQNILRKLSTSECSNRTELLAAAWLNLQDLIRTNSNDVERWTPHIIKFTLESMLTVWKWSK